MAPKRLSGSVPNYAKSFASNRKAYGRANSAFGKAKTRFTTGKAKGGTFGRTGKTAGNVVYGAFKAKRLGGQIAHVSKRAAGSFGGRVLLTGASQMAIAGVTQRRNSNNARRAGYSEKQIRDAHIKANRKGSGMGRVMAGSYLAQAGGQIVGRKSKKGNLIGAGLLAGGSALTYSGTKAHNKQVNKVLSKQKAAGNPRMAAKMRGKGMTRSQAASVAAKARWGRR